MTWREIDTAPKDGTVIRAKRVYRRQVIADGLAFFGSVTIAYDEPQTVDGVWVRAGEPHFFPTPTHWLPLPEPPKDEP